MASLLDIAKQQQQIENSSSVKTLLDVAKQEQQKANEPKFGGMTLMGVAKQQQPVADKASLLSGFARQIDAEDSARAAAAVVETAKEVKTAQQASQSAVISAAVEEIHKEDVIAAISLRAAVEESTSRNDNNATEGEDDGYSSFEDDDNRKVDKSTKDKSATKASELDGSDASESGEPAGPERTTINDSQESKELLRAVFRADKSRIRELLDDGDVDANAADQHGWSALHWAASQAHSDVMSLLLSKGASVNLVDHMNGWAPLHIAAVRQALSCVKLLLDAGADTSIVDLYGDSPVDLALATRGKKRVKLLELLHSQSCSSSNQSA